MPHYYAHDICHLKNYVKKNRQQNKQKQNVTRKSKNSISKIKNNDVKRQSDKTLTATIYVFLTIQQMEFLLNETRQQVDKKRS